MGNARKAKEQSSAFQAFLCEGVRLRPFADLPLFLAAGRLKRPFGRKPPADRETLEKPRSKAQLFKRFCAWGTRRSFFPARETGAVRGHALGNSRVRARLGAGTNPVRDLPGAAARLACRRRACVRDAGKKRPGARLAHRRCGLLPGRREQKPGFLPARENRSPVWAHTRNQTRACETWGRKRHGARLARRSRATCPPQVCPAQPRARNQPRACAAWCRHKPGARLAHRRRATCPAQPRDLLTAGAGFLPARETGAVRGRAPGTSRVRARLGKGTNRVRDLPAAGAQVGGI